MPSHPESILTRARARRETRAAAYAAKNNPNSVTVQKPGSATVQNPQVDGGKQAQRDAQIIENEKTAIFKNSSYYKAAVARTAAAGGAAAYAAAAAKAAGAKQAQLDAQIIENEKTAIFKNSSYYKAAVARTAAAAAGGDKNDFRNVYGDKSPLVITTMHEPASGTLQDNAPSENDDRARIAGADSLKNKDVFSTTRYPEDLATTEQPHWLFFAIQIRKSDLSGTETEASGITFDTSSVVNPERNGKNFESGMPLAVAANALRVGKSLSDLVGVSGATKFAVGVTAVGAGAIVGSELAEDVKNKSDRTIVVLKDAIALYLPGKPITQYQANWADEELGVIGGGFDDFKIKDPDKPLESLKELLKTSGRVTQNIILQGSKNLLGPFGNVGGAVQVSGGVTPNPFKAQLFKSMGFRTFSFEYVFMPKNGTEYASAIKIIKTFKKYMHPKLGPNENKYILSYPAEFNITYNYLNKPNENVFKIANCALTGMTIDYGGTDFTTFKAVPGAPSEINMKLTFLELEMLTRERIEAGY